MPEVIINCPPNIYIYFKNTLFLEILDNDDNIYCYWLMTMTILVEIQNITKNTPNS